MGKTDYSAIGMAYLEPRIKDLMPCIGYVFSNPLRDDYKNSLKLCMPMDGGPCVYGCGYIKYFKFWEGSATPPAEKLEIYRNYKDGQKPISEKEFMKWVELMIIKYPQVRCVKLFGSRARGTAGPYSDWDILIDLGRENKYQYIAKKISFDLILTPRHYNIDLWFLSPDGLVKRYQKRVLIKPVDSYPGFQNKLLIRNTQSQEEACCKNKWTNLYADIQTAKVIFQREGA